MVIRPALISDCDAIAAIYNHYVLHTTVTFEEAAITRAEMISRWRDVADAHLPYLVAEESGEVRGYAYAGKWKVRSGYRFSVEISVYLSKAHTGRGLGSALYGELFPLLQQRGIHAVMGGIALPNDASIALHERFNMRKVAHFDEVGFKFDQWIAVGYWQRLLGE